jgi:hypothetical protein
MKRMQRLKRVSFLSAATGGALLMGFSAHADTLDLTAAGASQGDGQGAIYSQTSLQSTGSGVIDPFLTIKREGAESGYNTDATTGDLLDDLRATNQYVRSVKIGDVLKVNYNGDDYAKFLLDVNESNGGTDNLLSLNKLQLFATEDPNLTGYMETSFTVGAATDGFGAGNSTLLYDLDALTDNTVELDYNLNHGSGSGDMFVYIPYNLIAGKGTYLVMYSSFGVPNTSSAGFEEWSVVTGDNGSPAPGPGLPLPSAATGGALILGGLGFCRRSRRPA